MSKSPILNKKVIGWALYDWANSAFALSVLAVLFPLVLGNYWSIGDQGADVTARLGWVTFAASAIVCITAPVFGTIADAGGYRKRFLFVLAFIGALISICPLLGLLGTVVGMIHVFDLMAVTGTGDARAMASGVSLATIPTMAGMVVALSGLFFRADLQQRVGRERQRAITLFHGQRG